MPNVDAFYAFVGGLIREARERRGVTQEALATLVLLSRTSLTNIERGGRRSGFTRCAGWQLRSRSPRAGSFRRMFQNWPMRLEVTIRIIRNRSGSVKLAEASGAGVR